jgi:hypothetical protein
MSWSPLRDRLQARTWLVAFAVAPSFGGYLNLINKE